MDPSTSVAKDVRAEKFHRHQYTGANDDELWEYISQHSVLFSLVSACSAVRWPAGGKATYRLELKMCLVAASCQKLFSANL